MANAIDHNNPNSTTHANALVKVRSIRARHVASPQANSERIISQCDKFIARILAGD